MSGVDAGKQSVVTKVVRKKNRLYVKGLRLVKRRIRATENTQGAVITKEAPVHYSQVALVDPADGCVTILFIFSQQENSSIGIHPIRINTYWLT